MKRSLLKKLVYVVVMVTLMFSTMLAEAATVVHLTPDYIGKSVPLQTYAPKKVYCYTAPNGSKQGWIAANVDLIKITQIRSDKWAYGSYPTSKGRVSRWFKLSDIIPTASFSPCYTKMRLKNKVYRTANNNSTIGTVYKNESILVVSKQGNRCQIIYKLDNGTGYKMGWVPNSSLGIVPL